MTLVCADTLYAALTVRSPSNATARGSCGMIHVPRVNHYLRTAALAYRRRICPETRVAVESELPVQRSAPRDNTIAATESGAGARVDM